MSQVLTTQCFCMSRKSSDGSNQLVAVVPCGHVLHRSCLLAWWRSKPTQTCPSCNSSIPTSRNNQGFVNLYGLDVYDGGQGGGGVGAPSSDAMTQQETQEIIEQLERSRRGGKGKGRRVVEDDEEEDDGADRDRKEVDRLRGELINAMKEVAQYKKHGIDLDNQLREVEGERDGLRMDNNELEEEMTEMEEKLAKLNADMLDELEELNQSLEEDLRKAKKEIDELNFKVDRLQIKSNERKHTITKLEAALAKEGDSGSKMIQELEEQIDGLQEKLMLAQRRGDLLEVEMAGISSEAEKKIDRIKEEAKRRVSEYERTTKHAQDDLEKVSELLSAAKSGNRRHESQYEKLKKRYQTLLQKKGKQIVDSEDEDALPTNPARRNLESPSAPTRSRTESTGRPPLASTSAHNQIVSPNSTPPPPPAFKIKNYSSLFSPNKVNRADQIPVVNQEEEEEEEDDIYAPVPPESVGRSIDEGLEEDDDDDIMIIEPAHYTSSTKASLRSRPSKLNQLDFTDSSTSHPTIKSEPLPPPPPPSTKTSKYFPSSSSAPLNRNPFPSLSDSTNSSKVSSGGASGQKRPFERSKSDKHLPDFGREGVAVQVGPKSKIRRKG